MGQCILCKQPTYQVNADISAGIGGGLNGNATKLLPEGGWSTTLVANLFTETNNQTQGANINNFSALAQSGPKETSKPKKIGGSIGGGVAFIVIFSFVPRYIVRNFSKLFKKPKEVEQDQYSKPELENITTRSDSLPLSMRTTQEMRSIHGVISEASGNARSELVGGHDVAEMHAWERYEKDIERDYVFSLVIE